MISISQAFSANTVTVVVGTSLLGLCCGIVGTFMVLRRRALVGDALAHAALPGICISFLVLQRKEFLPLLGGALVFGLLSVGTLSFVRRATRVKEDAAIAIVLSSFFGLGIALSRLIQNTPSGNSAGLDSFIFGKAASLVSQDVAFISITAIISVLIVALLFKELKLLCFDRQLCSAHGFSVRLLDWTLMSLVCMCTVVGLPAVGVVLVSALLIFPGVTARLWSNRLESVVPLAGLFGLLAACIGTFLSAELPGPHGSNGVGIPTGPLIVLCAAALFALSVIARAMLRLVWSNDVTNPNLARLPESHD